MRKAYMLALIVFTVFAANVAISHMSAMTLIDSTVIIWSAPAAHPAALADAVVAPVTDTGDSARAGEPVAREQRYDTDRIKLSGLDNYFPTMGIRPKSFTFNTPVTDLVT